MKTSIPVYDICSLTNNTEDDILINRFAAYLAKHKNLFIPHKHSFYHLVYFTQGSGSQTIDFEYVPVKPHQIYFMVPGQVHNWNFEGNVDGYIINFSAGFFQSFLLKAGYLDELPFFSGIVADSVIDIPVDVQANAIALFEQLVTEHDGNKPLKADMIRATLLKLFITIARLTPAQRNAPTYNYTLLRNFQKLIEKNYTTLKLPKEYAELLFITPNHLNALCNAMLGISAGEVIRNRIALEAKRLLINRELTVAEIADQLNFADNSYFTKFFKKQAGVTPEEFRRNNQK
ncbi:helix-turn-helix domain-containing protein [Mucilaginibacter auburnensis]|uniref:AraC-like DNA-binding protein n=1 Tax=Mucilaginibacter auburnensis TaxID=1457233 RepID=A0A2H9VQN0_9SPHI|nr:helix-turn-helix transcriptional regulator [Mucilaginibacter auburnensis]PJJ83131.1 AraC-like DNA-binding protein [Mucilaginibacter auburnensis]